MDFLLQAVDSLQKGMLFIDHNLSASRMKYDAIVSQAPDISEREKSTLEMVLNNKTNAQMADALSVTQFSIKKYIHSLLKKFEVESRKDLLKKFGVKP